jgi:hypothetical protein
LTLLVALEDIIVKGVGPLRTLLLATEKDLPARQSSAPLQVKRAVMHELDRMLTGVDGVRARVHRALSLGPLLAARADDDPLSVALEKLDPVARGIDELLAWLGSGAASRPYSDHRPLVEAMSRLLPRLSDSIEANLAAIAAHEIDIKESALRVFGRYASLIATQVTVAPGMRCRFANPGPAAARLEEAFHLLAEVAIERAARKLDVRGGILTGRARVRLDLEDDGRPLERAPADPSGRHPAGLLDKTRGLFESLGGQWEVAPAAADGTGLLIRIVLPTHLV